MLILQHKIKSTFYFSTTPWPVCEATLLEWPSVQLLKLGFFLFEGNTLAGLFLLKEHQYMYFHNQALVSICWRLEPEVKRNFGIQMEV